MADKVLRHYVPTSAQAQVSVLMKEPREVSQQLDDAPCSALNSHKETNDKQ